MPTDNLSLEDRIIRLRDFHKGDRIVRGSNPPTHLNVRAALDRLHREEVESLEALLSTERVSGGTDGQPRGRGEGG